MILTCPACATSYFTPDDAIGEQGRRVRCQSCAHVWLAQPEMTLSDRVDDGAAIEETRREFDARSKGPDKLSDTPAPELPKAYRAQVEQKRRLRKAATQGVIWAGLASVFVGLLAAAWLMRVEVVDLYPRAAAAYAMAGIPVNPTGLDFEAVGAREDVMNPGQVVVSGAVRNVRDREVVVPPIRIALLDAHGSEIGHRLLTLEAAPVLPGGVQGFAAVIADPRARTAGVGVDFAASTRRSASDHGTASSHDAAKDAYSTPEATPAVVRAPPPANEGGLRPALGDNILTPHTATPVEARPIADDPAESGDHSAQDHGDGHG